MAAVSEALMTAECTAPLPTSAGLDEQEASMRRVESWIPFNNALAIAAVIGVTAAFYPIDSSAQEGHSHSHQVSHSIYHYLYNGIMRPDSKNSSCCSEQDCAPSEAKWDGTRKRWTALRYGEWIGVPASKIVPWNQVPYGLGAEPHLCAPPPSWSAYSKDEVFCFIEPGGGT